MWHPIPRTANERHLQPLFGNTGNRKGRGFLPFGFQPALSGRQGVQLLSRAKSRLKRLSTYPAAERVDFRTVRVTGKTTVTVVPLLLE
jgi:hypothetical protein